MWESSRTRSRLRRKGCAVPSPGPDLCFLVYMELRVLGLRGVGGLIKWRFLTCMPSLLAHRRGEPVWGVWRSDARGTCEGYGNSDTASYDYKRPSLTGLCTQSKVLNGLLD